MNIVLAIILIVVLNVAGNLIAQRIYPTLTRDSMGRRMMYRVVFVGSFLVSIAVVALIGTALGFK